jgi:hypothetical protein
VEGERERGGVTEGKKVEAGGQRVTGGRGTEGDRGGGGVMLPMQAREICIRGLELVCVCLHTLSLFTCKGYGAAVAVLKTVPNSPHDLFLPPKSGTPLSLSLVISFSF